MKVKFDVSSEDASKATGKNYEQPQPGVYTVKVREVEVRDSKAGNPMLVVNCEVVNDDKYEGSYLRDYIGLTQSTAWKLDQFLQAFGVTSAKKRAGELDTDDLIGCLADVRVKGETYNDAYQAKISGWIISLEDAESIGDDYDEFGEPDADLDLNTEGVEDDDEVEAAPAQTALSFEDEYDAMSTMALRKECEERGLKTAGPKPQLVERLRDNDNAPAF